MFLLTCLDSLRLHLRVLCNYYSSVRRTIKQNLKTYCYFTFLPVDNMYFAMLNAPISTGRTVKNYEPKTARIAQYFNLLHGTECVEILSQIINCVVNPVNPFKFI